MARSLRQYRIGNEWFQIDENNPADPDFDGKSIISDLSSGLIESPLSVTALASNSAIINLYSNLAAASGDQWQINAEHTNEELLIRSKASGTWKSIVTIDGDGDLRVLNAFILGNSRTTVPAAGDVSLIWDDTNKLITGIDSASAAFTMPRIKDGACWDDLRVPMQNTKVTPSKSEPAFENFADGLYAFAFDSGNADDESLHFAAQLPHTYKEGTDIAPHVHWMPSTTNGGNVVWELEYTWANINGTVGSSTKIKVTDAADGTALKHQLSEFAHITGTSKTISSMLICRLTRLTSDAADTFTGDCYVLEFDFHHQVDAFGSDAELTK